MNEINFKSAIGVVVINAVGLQDSQTVSDTFEQTVALQKYLELRPAETKVLINTRGAGPVRASAIPAAIRFMDGLEYRAAAIVRDTGMMRPVVDAIMKHTGKANKVTVFDDEQTAQEWLSSLQPESVK